jgi:DNA modification methylase
MVARSLLRSYIGIELNPYYADIAEKRLVDVNAMAEQREAFNEVQDLLPS